MKNFAVFLDRDGTINEEMGYINHLDRFVILPGVIEAIKLLKRHNFKVIVTSNQAGVAMGYFSESLIEEIHNHFKNILAENGTYLDAIYYCPHHPQAKVAAYGKDCPCRKPKTGLILKAKEEFNLDLNRCYVVGDKFIDIEFAHNAGLKSILVLTGYGKGEIRWAAHKHPLKPNFVAKDLYQAAKWIINEHLND